MLMSVEGESGDGKRHQRQGRVIRIRLMPFHLRPIEQAGAWAIIVKLRSLVHPRGNMAASVQDHASVCERAGVESASRRDPRGDALGDALFDTRMGSIAHLIGASTLDEFVEILRIDGGKRLHRAVTEAIAIHDTGFLCDHQPFQALRKHVLPLLIAQNRPQRRLTLWSAACSTGQEPYSLAMLLREDFPETAVWEVRIVGTDIAPSAIAYAERARYCAVEVNRGLSARLLQSYFQPDCNEWQLDPGLRAACEFKTADLADLPPSLPQFDLILMRNVLLYLPEADRSRVFAAIHRHLHPQGYLLLGDSEQAEDSTALFRAEVHHDTYFYRPIPLA